MRGDLAEVAPEEQLGELLRHLGEVLKLLDAGLASLRVARAQRRRHELVQQSGFPVGRRAEGAQVAGGEPVARELGTCNCDLDVPGLVVPLASLAPRLQQAELL